MIKLENRIILRKPEKSDIDTLYSLKNDIEANALLGGFNTMYSKADIDKWIDYHNSQKNEVIFVIELSETNELVGHVGLYNIDYRTRKCEFAILIASKEAQGKGLGRLCTEFMIKYAFEQLNIRKIHLSLLCKNERSLSLYSKCGFKQEGLLKNDIFKNGQYHDVILMAMFNE